MAAMLRELARDTARNHPKRAQQVAAALLRSTGRKKAAEKRKAAATAAAAEALEKRERLMPGAAGAD